MRPLARLRCLVIVRFGLDPMPHKIYSLGGIDGYF